MNLEIKRTLYSTFASDTNGAGICWSKVRWFVKAEAQRWSVRLADGSNKLLKKENLEVKADASQGGVGDLCFIFLSDFLPWKPWGSLFCPTIKQGKSKSSKGIFRLCFGSAVDAMMNHHRT